MIPHTTILFPAHESYWAHMGYTAIEAEIIGLQFLQVSNPLNPRWRLVAVREPGKPTGFVADEKLMPPEDLVRREDGRRKADHDSLNALMFYRECIGRAKDLVQKMRANGGKDFAEYVAIYREGRGRPKKRTPQKPP